MPSETTREVVPTRGNTLGGQRSPGHWVANEPGPWEDMTRIAWSNLSSGGRSWWRTSRPEGKPTGRCTTRLTVAQYLGGVLVFAARRQANHRREGCMRVSA